MFLNFKNANTMHFKKSLHSIVVKKNVHKNVKCSRFECPYCKADFIYKYYTDFISGTLKTGL